MSHCIEIRKGNKEDLRQVLALIQELAVYERAPNEVIVNEAAMSQWLDEKLFQFMVAQHADQLVGVSLFYIRYSTWKGPMIYLEDIVVTEKYRRQKIGSQLFEATAHYCARNNYYGMTWQVLDWNEPAISFYKKYNSEISTEWCNGKLTSQQIREAAWNK
jgi:GNAT superfamily N-acetyltransferase